MEVNSQEYWNHRFDTDWVQKLGDKQSTFFAQVAIGAFPQWLKEDIKQKALTVCDWGCAMGDGTKAIKEEFPENNITGIDFSTVAIDKAKEKYPEINFNSNDLLNNPLPYNYNIIFSSNTLEHFSNPWTVLEQLSFYATHHLIVEIPYKEYDRFKEHLYSFDEKNIPLKIGKDFSLTHFEIVDTGKLTPTYWSGLQIVLVYSLRTIIESQNLRKFTAADLMVLETLRIHSGIVEEIRKNNENLISQRIQDAEIYKQIIEEKEEVIKWSRQITIQNLHQKISELMRSLEAKSLLELEMEQQKSRVEALLEEIKEANKQLNEKAEIESQLKEKINEIENVLIENEKILENLFDQSKIIHRKHEKEKLELIDKMNVLNNVLTGKESLIHEKEERINELGKELENLKVKLENVFLLENDLNAEKLKVANLMNIVDKKEQIEYQMLETISKLEADSNHLLSHLQWYKDTFETRSVLGLLKQKIFNSSNKK